MKKILILIIIIIGTYLLLDIPKYIELNDLKIIDRITINCDNIILREIIPVKDDNSIEYKYKYYNKINNNFYYKKAKIINKCQKKKN